jgi:hypothetical protein
MGLPNGASAVGHVKEGSMKTTMIAATIALGLAAGAALADQPLVLTDTPLDQVTGGPTMVEYGLLLTLTAIDKEVSVEFTAAERAGQTGHMFQHFDPTGPGTFAKIVPPGGFVGVRP